MRKLKLTITKEDGSLMYSETGEGFIVAALKANGALVADLFTNEQRKSRDYARVLRSLSNHKQTAFEMNPQLIAMYEDHNDKTLLSMRTTPGGKEIDAEALRKQGRSEAFIMAANYYFANHVQDYCATRDTCNGCQYFATCKTLECLKITPMDDWRKKTDEQFARLRQLVKEDRFDEARVLLNALADDAASLADEDLNESIKQAKETFEAMVATHEQVKRIRGEHKHADVDPAFKARVESLRPEYDKFMTEKSEAFAAAHPTHDAICEVNMCGPTCPRNDICKAYNDSMEKELKERFGEAETAALFNLDRYDSMTTPNNEMSLQDLVDMLSGAGFDVLTPEKAAELLRRDGEDVDKE